jgi:hypothetical protein
MKRLTERRRRKPSSSSPAEAPADSDPTTPPPPEQPTPHHTETVPGPGPDDPPYPNGAQPTMIDGAKPVPLRDDPPGFPAIPAGPQREQNWRDYLNGVGPDGSRLVSPPGRVALSQPRRRDPPGTPDP